MEGYFDNSFYHFSTFIKIFQMVVLPVSGLGCELIMKLFFFIATWLFNNYNQQSPPWA